LRSWPENDLGEARPFGISHLRSLIQLRCPLALGATGTVLPSVLPKFKVDPVTSLLRPDLLEEEAVEDLSALASEKGKRIGEANVILSANLPRSSAPSRRAAGNRESCRGIERVAVPLVRARPVLR
jgi:hypothetical protein